jgi:hypothetical protein
MTGQRETGSGGTIPEFDTGPYVLDDDGMFRRKEDLGTGTQEDLEGDTMHVHRGECSLFTEARGKPVPRGSYTRRSRKPA